jgi:hypothetical protein
MLPKTIFPNKLPLNLCFELNFKNLASTANCTTLGEKRVSSPYILESVECNMCERQIKIP